MEQPSYSTKWMPTLIEAQASGFQLMNAYNSVYFRSFLKAMACQWKNSNKDNNDEEDVRDNNVYDRWQRFVNKELSSELRSSGFTSILSRYTESLAELYSIYRRAGLPADYFHWQFDYLYSHNLPSFFSLPSKEAELAPHDVVFTKRKARLLHYHCRRTGDKGWHNNNNNDYTGRPLLIIYAPVNRFHILDLNQQRSVVRNLLSHGVDVYLLDWGCVNREDDDLSLDDYVGYVHEVMRIIKNDHGGQSEKVSLLGYCWGGIIALIYSSLHNNDVRGLVLMATPIDFDKDDTVLATWSRAIDADKMMDEFGHMDGYSLDMAFLMRNPPRYTFGKYKRFFEKLRDSEFVRTFIEVERWLYDTPPIPGKCYRQIIDGCYKNNNLLASNKMEIIDSCNDNDGGSTTTTGRRRQTIDLAKITVPMLSIIAETDNLVAPKSSLAVNDCVSSKDKTVLKNPGGHVALCIGDPAHNKLWPQVAEWILSR